MRPLDSRRLFRQRRTGRSRRWLIVILALLLIAGLAAGAVVGCTALGAAPEGDRLARIKQSPQWHGKKFENPQPSWIDTSGVWRALFREPSIAGSEPLAPVPVVHNTASTYAVKPVSGLRVTWFGHSSALVEIDGTTLLIDPWWSERASPSQSFGPKRWYAPPMALADLPPVDAVLISHDHYDHLDEQTLVAMAASRAVFVVPLGVGAHLVRWGIPQRRIVELDWWQTTRVGTLDVVATPSRHASGRSGVASNQTLWAGYAMVGAAHRVWYSGDTGFHDGLASIGERLGPFDLTLIEAGQYDAHWPDNHLGPEQAVEAHRLVRGKSMIPVHWALVKLAPHAWTEPVERVLAAAARCGGDVKVLVPRPGELVEPTLAAPTTAHWWPDLAWRTEAQFPIAATKKGEPGERMEMASCR